MTIAVFLSSLLAAMLLGVPIAYSLLLCGAALMWHLNMFDAQILAQNIIEGSNSFPLLANNGKLLEPSMMFCAKICASNMFRCHIRAAPHSNNE